MPAAECCVGFFQVTGCLFVTPGGGNPCLQNAAGRGHDACPLLPQRKPLVVEAQNFLAESSERRLSLDFEGREASLTVIESQPLHVELSLEFQSGQLAVGSFQRLIIFLQDVQAFSRCTQLLFEPTRPLLPRLQNGFGLAIDFLFSILQLLTGGCCLLRCFHIFGGNGEFDFCDLGIIIDGESLPTDFVIDVQLRGKPAANDGDIMFQRRCRDNLDLVQQQKSMHAAKPRGQFAAVGWFPVESGFGESFGESYELIAEVVGRFFDESKFDQRLPRRTATPVGTNCGDEMCGRFLLSQAAFQNQPVNVVQTRVVGMLQPDVLNLSADGRQIALPHQPVSENLPQFADGR